MDSALSPPIGSHDDRRLETESLRFEFTMGQHQGRVLSAEQSTRVCTMAGINLTKTQLPLFIDTIGQELAAQKEPFKPIATPITVGGFRFDDEKPLKDGEGGCNFRYFLTADKATTLWDETIERARRPYADEPEASTQAPNSTGNGAKLDNPTKALGGPPETGEGALQSTQHESTETPHGKSAKDCTAAAGSSEEPTKARPATPAIAIDLEERPGQSSSKQDQDNSKLQLPTASEHGGEEGSIEGGLELELSQIPPSQPFNLLEESL